MLYEREKVWIIGAKGQIGSAFSKLLDTRTNKVFLTDIDDVDITDSKSVMTYAEIYRPDFIINCAGVRGIKYCEENKDHAFKVNALGARNVAVAARSINAKLIHISTDDIFDGRANEPYDEFTEPQPTSVYGKSKLAGEKFVREIAQKKLIIRSSWVYGDGYNFVTNIINKAKNNEPIEVFEGQIGSPTSAKEVAKVIFNLVNADAYGTYHASCTGVCSRYDVAKKILELCNMDGNIVKVDSDPLHRPHYAVLDNLMLRISDIPTPKNWEEALIEYLKEYKYM